MINKITTDILDVIIKELTEETVKKKIEDQLIEPSVFYIIEKIKPYIIGLVLFLITMTILMISIIFMIVLKK